MSIRVSVAMTTYNGEKYLEEQLESIYTQTRLPDEVVVVDDGSWDGTVEILQRYYERYGLIYYINEKRLGFNQNFGKAISLCTGDYIALCDQDDIWFAQKIEKSLRYLQSVESPGVPALVSSQCQDIDENRRVLPKKYPSEDTWNYYDTLWGMNNSQGCCFVFNKALAERVLPIPPNKEVIFDMYIALVAAMVGVKYNMAEPLMYYRHHGDNAIARISEKSRSLKDRLRVNKYSRIIYPDFIPCNERFALIGFVCRKFRDQIPPERLNLVEKLLLLGDLSLPLSRRLNVIWTLQELSRSRKLKVISNAFFAALYKLCMNAQ